MDSRVKMEVEFIEIAEIHVDAEVDDYPDLPRYHDSCNELAFFLECLLKLLFIHVRVSIEIEANNLLQIEDA